MKNPTNNNINLNIHNNIKDISGNINNNINLPPLQPSKRKKYRLFKDFINDISDNKQINIKNKNLLFSMKFNGILDELRKNREKNEDKIKDNKLEILRDSLDKTSEKNKEKTKELSIIPFKNKIFYKNEFNKILNNIDANFDNLFNDNSCNKIVKSNIDKKNASTQFPSFPPPPPPGFVFASNNTYNPLFNTKRSNSWGTINSWNRKPNHNIKKPIIKFNGQKPAVGFKNPSQPTNKAVIPPPLSIKKTKVNINREINGLDDIIQLIKDYPLKYDVEYNINMKSMHDIKKPLDELNAMIGMNKLKNAVVDQIIFFSQNLHKGNDFMHTVIYGPPGTGKTEIAKIMGKIFSSIGILKNNKFRKVTRADLIAGYLGQTAIKTRDVIKDCLGGVLFIDEAYALGNREKRDSFAKECIDTLCEGLSDHKDNLMVIIAGYEEDLDKCFFSYNQGLNSRFPWRFHTDDYKAEELNKIFEKKVKEIGWSLKKQISDKWFEEKIDYFKFYGRDIETLLAKTKIAHGRRVFCKDESEKRILIQKDIDKGFEMFTDNNEVKNRCEKPPDLSFLYI